MNVNDFARKPMRRNALWLLRLTALILMAMIGNATYADEALPKPIFKLTQGQGTEVCEAYLQRLSATEFIDNDPTKGKLSEPLLKGFADLKTVPLTEEEVLRLYNKLKSFEQYQDQNLHDNYYEKYNALHKYERNFRKEGQGPLENIKTLMSKHQQTPFVRYQTALDLDNDGKATDTVIKPNRVEVFPYPTFYFKGLFIIDDKLQRVEEAKMKAIFADQEILQWPSVTQFPPLVSSIDVFNYNGKTYFDGFLNVLLSSSIYSPAHAVNRTEQVVQAVFIHENFQTHKICEYQWVNGKVYPPSNYNNTSPFLD